VISHRTGISENLTTNIKIYSICAAWWSDHDSAQALDLRPSRVCAPRAPATSNQDSGRAPLCAMSRPTLGAAAASLGRLLSSAAHTIDAASPPGSIAHEAVESEKNMVNITNLIKNFILLDAIIFNRK
jgi:hypothetical protein